MASIQSPVSFTGNLVTKPTASDLLRSSSNGVCAVPLNSLGKAQLGAKRRDVTAMAKVRRVRKHEYPWPRNPTPNVEGGPLIHLSSFKPLTDRPKPVTLEFEKPLLEMQKTMNDVQKMMNETGLDMSGHLQELEKKYQQKMKALYTNLTPIQRVHIARHPDRPTFLDHIFNITDKFIELHGDRAGYDDPAIVTGLGSINGRTYMFIGHQKGRNTKENIQRNFGMPTPHGYRKALRLMNYADHHGFPIVTFVDTPGAYADLKSEELGQGEAIAYNLRAMYGLKVPVVSIVIGEGGSGGALAIACANKLLMLENAVFYVASPEACAAILYKSAKAAPKAAKVLKITAGSLTKIGICDGVIPEPLGGAHADPHWTSQQLKTAIVESVDELLKMDTETLLKHRAAKVRGIGRGITSLNVDPKKKRNMRKSDVPPVEVELRETVDKLRQKHIEAFRNATQLPTTDLEKMIVTLKKDTDAYYVEAAKVLGYQEKFKMLREKIVKARKVALTTPPALTEELDKLKREFRRKIPLTPDYPSLKAKLDMIKDLRETLYIASLRDHKPIEKLERVKDVLMSSGLRAKGKLAMRKLAQAREIPDDEESKAKIVAIHEEMQKAILEVMEKIDKIEGPPAGAARKVTEKPSVGSTEDDPSNHDAEVLLDESLAPVEDESLPPVENGIVPHVEDASLNPVEDESFPPKVSVEA